MFTYRHKGTHGRRGRCRASLKQRRPCNCHKVVAISQQLSAFPAPLPALCRAELGWTARARAAKRRARSGQLCSPGHFARGLGIPGRQSRGGGGGARIDAALSPRGLRSPQSRETELEEARPPSQAAACGATASGLHACSLSFSLTDFRRRPSQLESKKRKSDFKKSGRFKVKRSLYIPITMQSVSFNVSA